MGLPMHISVADEIAQVEVGRPHVVLLGAGASRAAFPNGERLGQRLPVMADFIEIVPSVRDLLVKAGIPSKDRNFEEIYADLALDESKGSLRASLEQAIADYFSSLKLPAWPTLYDRLVLSLRPKDVIATFNWDPFLIQAVVRKGRIGGYPKLLFLHGNVLQGYCDIDNLHGVRGAICSHCGRPLRPVKLLYPIRQKDYQVDPAIQSAWDAVRLAFKNAFMVTVFGYGAPQSDREAVDLLKAAWGDVENRSLEQFEIIDIREEDSLRRSWRGFIHTHHYDVHKDFHDSWIANHPRRTGEAWWNQYLEAAFIENNPVPEFERLDQLRAWFQPLFEAERRVEASRDGKMA